MGLGTEGLANNIPSLNVLTSAVTQQLSSGGSIITPKRVTGIILNDKEPYTELFNQFGGWNSVGTIFFQELGAVTTVNINSDNYAFPLYPNVINYPLINEIVYVISLPSSGIIQDPSKKILYYFQPINLWNSVHHNAAPSLPTRDESQLQDYTSSFAGNVRRITDNSSNMELDFGSTFSERLDIQNLLPFEGDILIEGRWGNSIRFSSTIKNKEDKPQNNWSTGTNPSGSAITIIRNGQGKDENTDLKPWIPTVENINIDPTSIYLTKDQKIQIYASSTDYSSYQSKDTAPTIPNEFEEEQIILTSGRLLLNSKKDHILLSSKKSISFNAKEGFNFDTPNNFVVKTGTSIKLGDKTATEPLLLGNQTVNVLIRLITDINTVFNSLGVTVGNLGVPLIAQASPAAGAALDLGYLKNQLEKLKSKKVFTK